MALSRSLVEGVGGVRSYCTIKKCAENDGDPVRGRGLLPDVNVHSEQAC